MTKTKLLILLVFLCNANSIKSQDTIKVMYYNLLNFPTTSSQRADTLKKIVQYVLPDVFLVNELDNQFGASLILNNALNQNGINYYQQATFIDGPDTDNLLFYDSNKLGLISQNEIQTALRDINEYVLYYKAPNLATTLDTAYFYMYSCHLKAGSSNPNPDLRLAEAQVFKNYLNGKTGLENIVFGGDFNFYSSSNTTEPAYNWVLNGGTVPLYDPIAMLGAWNNNSAFASIHTQSTRTSSFDGGATGGMDDRLDLIFIGGDLQTGSNKAKYIAGSYKAIGQDGNRFNSSMNSPASNGVVPTDIAYALYQMSDHLPVYLEIEVGGSVGISENNFINSHYFNSETQQLEVFFNLSKDRVDLKMYDLSGKIVSNKSFTNTSSIQTAFSNLKSGIYIINLVSGGQSVSIKVVVL